MAPSSHLNEYELAREKIMAKNAKMMAELGIAAANTKLTNSAASNSPSAPKSPSAAARKPRTSSMASPPEATRVSGRLIGKPAVVYRDDAVNHDEDYEKKPSKKKSSLGGGSNQNRSPWDNTSWPLGDAAREAAQAAQSTMDALPNPSFCKIILPSMCAGRGLPYYTTPLSHAQL